MSECIAERPPGWINRWDFNRASCWSDEQAALDCVPPEERDNYRLYAYRAIPLVFDDPGEPARAPQGELFLDRLPALPSDCDLPGYLFLGYDVVEYAGLINYGCSPLSCNGLAAEHSVNRYCLLDRVEDAFQAARAFGKGGAEPGPYIIFEVWRKEEAVCRREEPSGDRGR